MTEVKIEYKKPLAIMAIVAELREHGLAQRRDFDFAYYPATEENFQVVAPCHTIFTFYNDSVASWFALKYSE